MEGSELLKLAERELAAAQEEAKKALTERDAAQARLDLANRSVQAWYTIVEQKQKAAGITLTFDAPPIPPPPGFTEDDALSLTQSVRDLLKKAGARGMTPGEIRSETPLFGPMSVNFPHGILGKLKARGEVEKIRGKYVAVEFLNPEPSKNK
jgi:hypothetical protein